MKIVGEGVVLASRVLRDSPTDSVSLIDCLDIVSAPFFPWGHQGFSVAAWFRLDGDPPTEDVAVSYRIVRFDGVDAERVISSFPGVWQAGTRRARMATSFQQLNLVQPGRLQFRVDFKVADGEWEHGSSATLDVLEAEMSDDDREKLASVLARLGEATAE